MEATYLGSKGIENSKKAREGASHEGGLGEPQGLGFRV